MSESASGTPPAPRPPVNVQQTLAELLHTNARLDAYKARAGELRDALAAEALDRWKADGAVSSWRVARLGTASLAGAESDPEPRVDDDDAYAEWVMNNHPTECDLVLRIPGHLADGDQIQGLVTTLAAVGVAVDLEPNPSFLNALVTKGRLDVDAGQLWTENGECVPGVGVHKKDPYLSVRLLPEAKARARAELDRILEPPHTGARTVADDVAALANAGALDDLAAMPCEVCHANVGAHGIYYAPAEAPPADAPQLTIAGKVWPGVFCPTAVDDPEEGAGDAEPDEDATAIPERTSSIELGDPEAPDDADTSAEWTRDQGTIVDYLESLPPRQS